MHRPCEEVGVLTQHVGHPEGGQLRVGVGVEQAVVGQGVEGVTGLVLHEVQQGRVGVVGGRDRRDLVVFVPRSPSSATAAASSSTAAAAALTGVALGRKRRRGIFLTFAPASCVCLIREEGRI